MDKELLSTQVAGDLLAEMLPDRDAEQWALWLRNNRNQARKATYRIPTVRISNGAFYTRDELAKFAEWEKSRRLGKITLTGRAAEALRAFGIGEAGGSTTGRKLEYSVTPQVGEDGSTFVQFVIEKPTLAVYRLDRTELAQLVKELAEAQIVLDRARAA
jgi:hypothetical protein